MGKKAVELYRCKNQHVTDAYDKAVFNICLIFVCKEKKMAINLSIYADVSRE